jgi:hypothetical protein
MDDKRNAIITCQIHSRNHFEGELLTALSPWPYIPVPSTIYSVQMMEVIVRSGIIAKVFWVSPGHVGYQHSICSRRLVSFPTFRASAL